VALLVEYFVLALVVVFYDSDSHLFCDLYDTPQNLCRRHAPKPVLARERAKVVQG
jgi:hypothetical protein